MAKRKRLESFSPAHLSEAAQQSGFFQCQKCGLIWFGRPDYDFCPEHPSGRVVHVAVLCRECDAVIPIEHFAEHLASRQHNLGH